MVNQPEKHGFTSRIILDSIEEHKAELRRLGVHKLSLFGSYRHGEAEAGSDIDLLVDLDNPTFDNYMNIKFFSGGFIWLYGGSGTRRNDQTSPAHPDSCGGGLCRGIIDIIWKIS